MNVSHQNTDNLNAVISIEISKADYQDKVDKSLRAYGQKANIPGFRKGKVPFSILTKMFGKSVRVEEINRLVSEALYNYIRDNKLNILGEPMTAEDMTVDLDAQDDFTFRFDVALAPELNVKVDKSISVPYYTITVDDDMVKRQDESFRARFGKQVSVDESTDEKDLIKGSMVELSSDGTPLEGGITVESTIVSPNYFKSDDEKAKFAGVKKGDKVVFNPSKSCNASVAELASMLNTDKEKAANVTSDFEMTVTDITHLQPAELNQEFFDSIFGKDTVKTEEEYLAKIREMIAHQLVPESDYRFSLDSRAAIEKAVGDFELPDAFLKRWLLATDKERKAETIDDDYSRMVPDLKWQLIKEQIVKQFDIHVDDNDLKAMAKRVAASQFAQYGMTGVPDDVLERYGNEMLSNKDTRSRLINQATEMKIQTAIKESVTLNHKEVSMENFQKLFETAE
ncbi:MULTISPECIES: trigger factor [unclassified Barnesiella]|uniref:trigger factor n=1 Tax=unclassified Barnesiella TaxID=2645177 RepID=UPI000B39DA1F|nr:MULTISPECIES: trigger factor [unclassified Barnesiella]MCR8911129.1 trigger factor [Barnesiella sp. ET7]OUO99633.1 trigger factor [Barnesiella sp. An22]HJB73164.1 trigger factor [Candidatus Barnesiella merdigallinarum]